MPNDTSHAAVYDVLDGDAYGLQRTVGDAMAPLTVVDGQGVRSLPLFRDASVARRHHDALPIDVRDAYTVVAMPKGDLRSKEEFLRAAAALGCVTLDVDPDASLHPAGQLPLATAISYVTSFRRESACL